MNTDISRDFRYKLDDEKFNSKQKWNSNKCQCEYKKATKNDI